MSDYIKIHLIAVVLVFGSIQAQEQEPFVLPRFPAPFVFHDGMAMN